jgi:hypothetical protein
MLAADDQERFSCLDTPEKGEKITLKVLYADGTHTIILAGGDGRASRRFLPCERAGERSDQPV